MAGFAGGRTAALYKEGGAQDVPVLTSLCPSSLVFLFKLKTARDILQSERLRSNPIIPDNLAKYRVRLANGVIDIKGSSYPLGSSLTQLFS
jgi:hypothetical protein